MKDEILSNKRICFLVETSSLTVQLLTINDFQLLPGEGKNRGV